jgi:hypothetical protein
MGCLTDLKTLAPSAEIIVTAKIDAVEKLALEPCRSDIAIWSQPRCGEVYELRVSADRELKGKLPKKAPVVVPRQGAASILKTGCDDRPEVEQMKGMNAVLFLESSGGRLWTLDGPDSIYAAHGKISSSLITRVRSALPRP